MAEKRRILCVITQGELGGAQQFVRQLAEHLDRDRFELTVAWGRDTGDFLARTLPEGTGRIVLQHLVRRLLSPWQDLLAIWELRRALIAHRPETLLLISSKSGFIGALAALGLKSRLPNLRVVYRIGGWSFNDPNPWIVKKTRLILEKLSAHGKDVIVVNNTHDLDQARMLGIKPRHKLVRIFNGIDPYLPLIDRPQARAYLNERIFEEYRHQPFDVLIGTIANHYPAKDLATLIRAAARIGGNVRFMVIGDGPLRPELDRMIKDFELEDRFFLVGRIANASRYLPAFDIFVLPSAKEGFPWALLEAMAAKVPAIATRVGAIPEMIEDGISGIIVPPGEPDRIAEAIVHLMADDRLRQDITIRAHQHVITTFSLRTMIAAFEQLL